MYTKRQKTLAFLICTAFIMVIFLSLFFIIKEADHDCTGEDCMVCVCIHQAEQTLRNLGTGTIKADGWVIIQVSQVLVVSCIFMFVPCTSLISQKVRLNN